MRSNEIPMAVEGPTFEEGLSSFLLWTGAGLIVASSIVVGNEAVKFFRKLKMDFSLPPAPVIWAERYAIEEKVNSETLKKQYSRLSRYESELRERKTFVQSLKVTFTSGYRFYHAADFYSKSVEVAHVKTAQYLENDFSKKKLESLSAEEYELYFKVQVTLYLDCRAQKRKIFLTMIEKGIQRHFDFAGQMKFYNDVLSKYPTDLKLEGDIFHKRDRQFVKDECSYLQRAIDKTLLEVKSITRTVDLASVNADNASSSSVNNIEDKSAPLPQTPVVPATLATPTPSVTKTVAVIKSDTENTKKTAAAPNVSKAKKSKANDPKREAKQNVISKVSTEVLTGVETTNVPSSPVHATKSKTSESSSSSTSIALAKLTVNIESSVIRSDSPATSPGVSSPLSSPRKVKVKKPKSPVIPEVAGKTLEDDGEELSSSIIPEVKERPVIVSNNFNLGLSRKVEPLTMKQYSEFLEGILPVDRQQMVNRLITQGKTMVVGSGAFYVLHRMIFGKDNPLTFTLKDVDLRAPRKTGYEKSKELTDYNFKYVNSSQSFLHLSAEACEIKENNPIKFDLTLTDDQSSNSIPFSQCCVGESRNHKLQCKYYDGSPVPLWIMTAIKELNFILAAPNPKETHFATRAIKWAQRLIIQGPYKHHESSKRILSEDYLSTFFNEIYALSPTRFFNEMARFVASQTANLKELKEQQHEALRVEVQPVMNAYFNVVLKAINRRGLPAEFANEIMDQIFGAESKLSLEEGIEGNAEWLLAKVFSLAPRLQSTVPSIKLFLGKDAAKLTKNKMKSASSVSSSSTSSSSLGLSRRS